jgi:hypothetical protein
MTRQVISGSASSSRRDAGGGVGTIAGTQDGYLERLLKLIPAETIAVYLFLDGVVRSGLAGSPALNTWLWGVFGVIGVGNFLYWKRTGVRDALQYVVLTVAYAVWIFTIGGPFSALSFYKPFMGSVILGLFTFFVPSIYKGVQEPA